MAPIIVGYLRLNLLQKDIQMKMCDQISDSILDAILKRSKCTGSM